MAVEPCVCADTVCVPDNYGAVREGISGCRFNLFNSGIAEETAQMNEFAMGPAWSANLHFHGDTLGYDEDGMVPGGEDLGCMDCESSCQKQVTVRRIQRNKCFTEEDCKALCNRAPESGEQMILEGVQRQMTTFREAVIACSLKGIYESNVANYGMDLIHDATAGGTVDPLTGGWFDYCAFVEGCGVTCCDSPKDILLTHCDVFKDMVKCEQIQFIQPASIFGESTLMTGSIPIYNNHIVIQHSREDFVDRTGPIPTYISICAKRGFFGLGNGMHKNPFSSDRDECYNNGDGMSMWNMREIFALHPMGFSNCWEPPAPAAGQKPRLSILNSELKLADTWSRCWDRSLVGVSFIKTYAGNVIVGKAAPVTP